uniref:Uncharacterized protein n=1 Tax=Pseudo-nitzschia delicatissima TaxID=44447 RepID=A0A7S0Y798_9STRA|mmetsp:Transcript_1660/g.3463  ORF Transcript_1660/g.3463 Transcript_1660/m.3463 type:complete len:172 (+) Transcript_1660:203-718(+)|eukprot:CAMPEP_0197269706 /NCGR_PEP_ID=MMETSP1432-20130617/5966_1 /TAXON_ID=44447 /ORGANISM="Pseudo-nitzschia delicatissima, Strain UNC1205" /LENGTH=171 /DNA_ID=CAMNT_0042734911 /DNA_START=130 /DNA_END=645 /DNA_ORIENTATION=+
MMFCPITFCPVDVDDQYTPAAKVPTTPLAEKAKAVTFTPATEAMTPGENASTALTGETSSFSSNDDSLSSETEKVSPIKPHKIAFEEPKKEETKKSFPIFKFLVLAMVYVFFAHSGSIFPKISASVDPVIESSTIETAIVEDPVIESPTIETTIVEEPAIDIDVNVEMEQE